ncbi:amino acid permease [Agrilactobacillus yilanensis]|uniref:Amino acid permease n=1 Tax=Agrilactobacillus yilanensis TaxID=2485997 RepID=A0ABW4J973_9LACO|nr:amino acid permease [Agrilactobacillus yilanensis]
MSAHENSPEMARNLKNRHVQLIAIGGTIGTGLFLGSGKAINYAGPSIILAYFITGVICFFLMRALGELLLSNLNYHSYVEFIQEYLGETVGFVAGWTYWFCWVAIAMSEITAVGVYIRYWLPNVPQWVPGLILLGILLLLNLITVAAFGETEFWFALIKIVAIVLLIVVGLFMILTHFKTSVGHASFSNILNHGGFFPKGMKGFLFSFQMVVFSFVGVELVGLTASETQDPETVLPKAINNIPIRIILFYVGALFVIISIFPWNRVLPDQSPFVLVFENVGIRAAADIINFVVITAAASACNSSIFSTGRMLFSLTYDSKSNIVKPLGKLSRHQVPAAALKFSAFVIALAVLLNIFIPESVFTFITSIATTSFLFIWGSIIVTHIRYKKTKMAQQSKFKAPLYPFSDYLVLAFLAVVFVILLLNRSTVPAAVSSIVWLIVMFILGYKHTNKVNKIVE